MSDWISVKDRLPEDHIKILVYKDNKYTSVAVYWTEQACLDSDYYKDSNPFFGDIFTGTVTHWMPLPEPPKR